MRTHLSSTHRKEFAAYEKIQKCVLELRKGLTETLKKLCVGKQSLLFAEGSGQKISLEKHIDPQKQKRFDEACVMFCAESNCSFRAMEKIYIIVGSL